MARLDLHNRTVSVAPLWYEERAHVSVPLAIIKGVLPPALLAVLFMLLPIVLRLMVKLQGEIRKR